MFNTTPEQLRALNGIVGDRVRIGQTIMVKPFTKEAVPTPPGAVPEQAPLPRAGRVGATARPVVPPPVQRKP